MANPIVTVELGDGSHQNDTPFGGGFGFDVTQYVDMKAGISITRGRTDEFSNVQPGSCKFVLNNVDGIFSPYITSATPTVLRTNLVPDPECEHLFGWSPVGIGGSALWSGTTFPVYTGGNNYILENTGIDDGTIRLEMSLPGSGVGGYPVTPGVGYTFQFQCQADTVARECMATINYRDADGNSLGFQNGSHIFNDTGTWTTIYVRSTAPAGAVYADGSMSVFLTDHGERHFFDALCFEADLSVPPLPYFDGNATAGFADDGVTFTRNEWTGEPHASTSQQVTVPTGPWVGMPVRIQVTVSATTTTRFIGYIDSLQVRWPGGNKMAQVEITASDGLAQLQRRAARSVGEEAILYRAPKVWFGLSEEEGATEVVDQAGYDVAPLSIQQRGSGGSITFGSDERPKYEGGFGATWARGADLNNGPYLQSTVSPTVFEFNDHARNQTRRAVSIGIFYKTSVVSEMTLLRVGNQTGNGFELGLDSTGKLRCGVFTVGSNPGTSVWTLTDTASSADGNLHLAHVSINPNIDNDGTVAVNMGRDGTVFASSASETINTGGDYTLYVGGGPSSAIFSGTLHDFMIFTEDLLSPWWEDIYDAVTNGFDLEDTGTRFGRFAQWLGYENFNLALGGGGTRTLQDVNESVAVCQWEDTAGKSYLDVLADVCTLTEGGLVCIGRTDQLRFHARTRRWSRPSAVTLDAHDTGVDTFFVLDNQLLFNRVEVDPPTNSTMSVTMQVAENKDSIALTNTRYVQNLAPLLTTTTEAADMADWRANVYGSPVPRLSAVAVDLLTMPNATAWDLQALEIEDLITISGWPSQAPASSMDLHVEGWEENISLDGWSMTFNTSARTGAAMWLLDDATYGNLDAGNRLGY